MRNNNYLVVAIFLILGAVIGWVAGSMYSYSKNGQLSGTVPGIGGGPAPTSAIISPNSKAADFRVQMHMLLRDHTSLAGQYLQAIVKGQDTSALKSALDINTQKFSNTFASVYGGNAGNDFTTMWNDHIKSYTDYAKAAKNNDSAGKANARDALIGESSDFQNFMDQLNQTSVDNVGNYMKEHIEGTLALVDAAVLKNDSLVVDLANKADDQAGKFADYLTDIITSEKPQLFQ